MSKITIFLDTSVLRYAFVARKKGEDWRQNLKLPPNVRLVTAHKCIAEMYGILKTNILDTELKDYGCESSKHLRDRVFGGDNFLNIFWHHQVLEIAETALKRTDEPNEYARRLKALVEWRDCYERARSDFDDFLKDEKIGLIHYGILFARHEWQAKFDDLATETLIPSEDLEIVLAAWFAQADIFLTNDKKLVYFSFSLPLEPGIPAFCAPKDLERKFIEKQQKIITYPDGG
ncbi:MAG: hypothetical protein SVX38_08100 [Chloroflexota bacterium]|nr:hypothetical protein [Chloroflexota bacterium]